MAAIERFLGIVELKNATGLVLVSGKVPQLLLGSGKSPLTMPALSPVMMEHLVADVLPAGARANLTAHGSFDGAYTSPTYGSFGVRARVSGETLEVTLIRGASAPSGAGVARAPDARGSEATIAETRGTDAAAEPTPSARVPEASTTVSPPTLVTAAASRGPSVAGAASITTALDQAIARGASDLIFSSGSSPLLRIDGDLIECREIAPIAGEDLAGWFASRIDRERQRVFDTTGSVDFSFDHVVAGGVESSRFRANQFRHGGGLAISLRPIRTEIPTLADLHLPNTLAQLVETRHGLILFTGATGSGKSTTLAALLEHVNRTRTAHVVTLEDPIEYAYRNRNALIHQREVGRHVDSFASGLRAALRENPDILLVGEMRDAETVRLALTAAQTGHLVLSTLHSGGSIMAIDRVIDAFPESEKSHVRQELAASLRHVVAQQLVPAANGGRLPAIEILTVTFAVASQIRDGRTHMVATQLETGADEGMVPMARALAALVRSGKVSRAAALSVCEDRAALEKQLEDRGARGRAGM